MNGLTRFITLNQLSDGGIVKKCKRLHLEHGADLFKVSRGIFVVFQYLIKVLFENKIVGEYFTDILFDDSVIIEF